MHTDVRVLKKKYQKNSQIGYIFLFVVMLILLPLV